MHIEKIVVDRKQARESLMFIYGEDQDFRNEWIYHHWTLLGQYARSAIWGM